MIAQKELSCIIRMNLYFHDFAVALRGNGGEPLKRHTTNLQISGNGEGSVACHGMTYTGKGISITMPIAPCEVSPTVVVYRSI